MSRTQFAAASPTSPVMGLRGVNLGRNQFNVGLGGEWKQTNRTRLFGDYVASLTQIARALANQCRYNGNIPFYSVAQHSTIMSEFFDADTPHAVWSLLHDAHEAVLGDITRPLRGQSYCRRGNDMIPLSAVEAELQTVLAVRLGLDLLPASVRELDDLMVNIEMLNLAPEFFRTWPADAQDETIMVRFKPLGPREALDAFLKRAAECGVDRLFDRSPESVSETPEPPNR